MNIAESAANGTDVNETDGLETNPLDGFGTGTNVLDFVRLLKDRHEGNVRWLAQSDCWLKWNDHVWKPVRLPELFPLADLVVVDLKAREVTEKDAAKKRRADKPKKKEGVEDNAAAMEAKAKEEEEEAKRVEFENNKLRALHRFISASQGRGYQQAAWEKTKAYIKSDQGDFDTKPLLVNLKNGTFDLESGQFRSHDKADRLTRMMNVDYVQGADCPRWKAFLADIQDEETIAYLKRAVGYSLTGNVDEHVLFFLWGNGQNGKTTLIKTLESLFGDYLYDAPSTLLVEHRSEQHPADKAGLLGIRFASMPETPEGQWLNEQQLKALTGGDRIAARHMREDWMSFEPTHKFWVQGNHKPPIKGTDDGIWRRIQLIPFLTKIPDAKKNPNLSAELRQELPGILNWALEGAKEWMEAKFTRGEQTGLYRAGSVTEAGNEYRSQEDSIGQFLTDMCIPGATHRCTKAGLTRAYGEWCSANGEVLWNSRKFNEEMRRRKYLEVKGTGGSREWQGLGLREIKHDSSLEGVKGHDGAGKNDPHSPNGHGSKVDDREALELARVA